MTPPAASHRKPDGIVTQTSFTTEEAELSMPNSNPVGAVLAAAMVGLLAGLITGPQVARAARPDFLLQRPDYMMGIDAANTSTKRGEIDFVTRSQINALEYPEALKESKAIQERMKTAPSKETRLQREKQQLKDLVKTTNIPA